MESHVCPVTGAPSFSPKIRRPASFHEQGPSLHVEHAHTVGAAVKDASDKRLSFLLSDLRGSAFRDVENGSNITEEGSVGGEARLPDVDDPCPASVGSSQPVLAAHRFLARSRPKECLLDCLAVIGMDDVDPTETERLSLCLPSRFQPQAIKEALCRLWGPLPRS